MERRLADDDKRMRGFSQNLQEVASFARNLVDDLQRIAKPLIGIGQVGLRADQADARAVLEPSLPDARIEDRRFLPNFVPINRMASA